METWQCDNDLCIHYRERWIIQINADGSIPTRQAGPKEFGVQKRVMDYGQAIIEQTKHEMGE